ncbi:hypothetical protein ABXN37_27730 [Piscinibacter sakaiensis]|uniref:hypothetical protein n=1 Tax=Piscinibacter sakaiensis TaxID=1547922 RepID=UPI0012FB5A6B|nr:hypothetical protein [Piscinibacter sakaiensis]
MSATEWTNRDKKIARAAFDAALKRELDALIIEFKARAARTEDVESLWKVSDWLERKRKEIDRVYDFRYSQLIFVFARLVERGVLDMSELEGLAETKLAEIDYLVRGPD